MKSSLTIAFSILNMRGLNDLLRTLHIEISSIWRGEKRVLGCSTIICKAEFLL